MKDVNTSRGGYDNHTSFQFYNLTKHACPMYMYNEHAVTHCSVFIGQNEVTEIIKFRES